MAKLHGGTHHIQGRLNRGAPKPEATSVAFHAGSGAQKRLHEAPTLPQVNSANYAAGHKVNRKPK